MNLLKVSPRKATEAVLSGKVAVGVLGLGRIGLPTAVMFAKAGAKVLGGDISHEVVKMIKSGISKFVDEPGLNQMLREVIASNKLFPSTDIGKVISNSKLIIVCVPTPINDSKSPDYSYVLSACESIGKQMQKGSIIVIESTVGPGTVEREVKTAIERHSGLVAGKDFGLASCPERSDPGRIMNNMRSVPRVVGALDEKTSDVLAEIYSAVFGVKVVKVSNPKTANAVKLTENLFRDVNIALANEFALLYEKLGVDTVEVINACSTKYNFMPHYPGCGVGGPCLPSNPYYLIAEAVKVGNIPYLVRMAREINDRMPEHVVELVLESLNDTGKTVRGSKIVLFGVSYKPDVRDIQLTPAERVYKGLKELGARLEVYDPYYCGEKVFDNVVKEDMYEAAKGADCVVILTAHSQFQKIDLAKLSKVMKKPACLVDSRNVLDLREVGKHNFSYRGVGRLEKRLC
ncbi:MAG: nucleotide sugar dehydrogenase [Conexivisphaerales archaeon]